MESRTFSEFEIDRLFGQGNDLLNVIGQIEGDLSKEGKVLCEIKVNGMPLSTEDEIRFKDSKREEIQGLEIRSQKLISLIEDSRHSLETYLIQLKEVSLKASDAIRAGVIDDANEMLKAIVDGTAFVVEMLGQIRTLDSGYNTVKSSWLEAESSFIVSSRELLNAFEINDLVQVADILEYEWGNSLDQWLKVLKEMS